MQTKSEEEMARWRELHRHTTLLACVLAPQKLAVCHMVSAAVGNGCMLPSSSFQQRHQCSHLLSVLNTLVDYLAVLEIQCF